MSRALLLCLCLPFFAATSALAAEQPGLLGHWKFDDAQGDQALDSSGNGNDRRVWDANWVQAPSAPPWPSTAPEPKSAFPRSPGSTAPTR